MTLAELLSQLDARPGVRGGQFERICAWYLRNAPEYRDRIRTVWLWSDWPNTWGADAGIDLVAEEHDGFLWAIQAKMYDVARQRHLLGDEQPPPRLVPWPIPREEVGVVSQQLLKHSFARVRLLRHRG